MVTRDEAKMSGRFSWYSHRRIAKLGYASLRAAGLGEWPLGLSVRSYIADSVMGKFKLAREVRVARSRGSIKQLAV